MIIAPSRPRRVALVVQLLAVCGTIAVLAAAPSASGRYLLVPISAAAGRGMAAVAIAHGAALVGQGPLPGSLVVDGDRAGLGGALFRRGVAVINAPVTDCGR